MILEQQQSKDPLIELGIVLVQRVILTLVTGVVVKLLQTIQE